MTANVVDRPVRPTPGSGTGFRAVVGRIRRDRWAVTAAVVIAVFVVVALAAPLIAGISATCTPRASPRQIRVHTDRQSPAPPICQPSC